MKKTKKNSKVFVCCDCGIWSEVKPRRCVCGSHCFTQEKLKEVLL